MMYIRGTQLIHRYKLHINSPLGWGKFYLAVRLHSGARLQVRWIDVE